MTRAVCRILPLLLLSGVLFGREATILEVENTVQAAGGGGSWAPAQVGGKLSQCAVFDEG